MYQRTLVSENIRVVSHEMPDRESIALGLWVTVGGRYEDDRHKGAAHFLEHIVFKGTKNYSCRKIKELIEGVGGSLNAFTSEEYTCYYAKIPKRYFATTFDVLSDMVLCPLITPRDVHKERTVILEEIKMYHDLPQYLVSEYLDELIWPNHPLGKRLVGTLESVGDLSHLDLRKFHHQYYSPANIVVSAAGHLGHGTLVNLVKEKVGKTLASDRPSFLAAQDAQQKPKVKFCKKETEQMHLAMGVIGFSSLSPDRYALNLLNIILGANMSSRLFVEVREKRGLAYAISSGVKYLKDTGMFTVRAGVDNHKIAQTIALVLHELEKIKTKGVSQGEFTRARDYYLGQVLLELEDTLDHMFWVGESTVTLDRVRTIEDIMKEVRKITMADVKRVGNLVLNENKYNLSVVGPLTEAQEKKIIHLLGASH